MIRQILLIEDNPGDVLLIERAFAKAKLDYAVTPMPDASQGWAYLERVETGHAIRPDLILLDVNLPGISGHTLCERLKVHPTLRTCPVVMLSSSSSPIDIRQAYLNHANSYVTKPSDLAGLFNFVDQIEAYWFEFVTTPRTD